MSFWGNVGKFFMGTPEKYKQVSSLSPQQDQLMQQQIAAAQGRGAGGAYGDVADYFRNLMGNTSADFEAFAAPEKRYFQEDILPQLAEQFAGLGAGGLSSSGFRNEAQSAGAGLAERLGAIRASLRQQGAQGLQNIGSNALNPYMQNVRYAAQPGFLSQGLSVAGAAFGAPFAGELASNWAKSMFNPNTKASPTGAAG